MVEALSLGIADMVYILNPEVVVLGGGIMTQREYLEKRLQATLSEKLFPLFTETPVWPLPKMEMMPAW